MIKRIQVFLAVFGLAAAVGAVPAAAQTDQATPDTLIETYGAWTVRCGTDRKNCHILQAMYRAEDKKRLMQVILFTPSQQEDQLYIRSLTPLGAVIPDGSVLVVDKSEPTTVPFYSCWPNGCVAEVPVSRVMERALRDGQTLAVQVKSAENGKTIRFELSLNGISKALDRMKALETPG